MNFSTTYTQQSYVIVLHQLVTTQRKSNIFIFKKLLGIKSSNILNICHISHHKSKYAYLGFHVLQSL